MSTLRLHDEKPKHVPTKTGCFFKGGCGCLLVLAVFTVLALLIPGGHVDAHGDPLGFLFFFLFLFLIGGSVGLLVRWIYKKGLDAGREP